MSNLTIAFPIIVLILVVVAMVLLTIVRIHMNRKQDGVGLSELKEKISEEVRKELDDHQGEVAVSPYQSVPKPLPKTRPTYRVQIGPHQAHLKPINECRFDSWLVEPNCLNEDSLLMDPNKFRDGSSKLSDVDTNMKMGACLGTPLSMDAHYWWVKFDEKIHPDDVRTIIDRMKLQFMMGQDSVVSTVSGIELVPALTLTDGAKSDVVSQGSLEGAFKPFDDTRYAKLMALIDDKLKSYAAEGLWRSYYRRLAQKPIKIESTTCFWIKAGCQVNDLRGVSRVRVGIRGVLYVPDVGGQL